MSKRPRPPGPPTAPPPVAAFGDRLADFAPLSPAEVKLKEACRTGELAVYGNERPEERNEDRLIRAAVLRVFCLGRDPAAPVHAHGVQITGAWIDGTLGLAGVTVPHPLLCADCRFDHTIILRDATTRQLIFDRSSCPGIAADRLVTHGGLFLRAFHTAGTVRFHGATIGGSLDCSGATFAEGKGDALACDSAKIAGSVFLNAKFIAHRKVRFIGATIGGDFGCPRSRFEASAPLVLDKATITGTLFLDDGFDAAGFVDLASASVGDLVDSPDAWVKPTWILDGFTYRRFAGDAPTDATARIRWLDRQPFDDRNTDFRPQPWEQCAAVLAAMGHDADAVRIRIDKRRRMRPLPLHRAKTGGKKRRLAAAVVHAVRRRTWAAVCAVPAALATYGAALLRQGLVRLGMVSDWLLEKSVGYGWRPQWAIGWLLLLWAVTAGLYAGAVPKGVMAPTDALVYQSRTIPAECKLDWLSFEPALRDDHDAAQIAAARALGFLGPADTAPPARVPEWKAICGRAMPAEYTTFSPWVYALDLLLPIVDLRQEKDWAPRVTDADGAVIAPLWPGSDWGWGYLTRLMEWLMIALGWGLSGMLLGAVTGVIRRD